MTAAPWIIEVLDRELPELLGGRRDEIAAAISSAIPMQPIVDAIAESAKHVLETRNIKDGAGDLAQELARNASQCVLLKLEEVYGVATHGCRRERCHLTHRGTR